MQETPKSIRLQIGLYGRSNVGKSSVLNAITRQEVAIVSPIAGTTTDPVEKPMEILPLGPVLFIDTAGIDDLGVVGKERVEKTRKIFNRTDLGIIITGPTLWGDFEESILTELASRKVPVVVILNKIDLFVVDQEIVSQLKLRQLPVVYF